MRWRLIRTLALPGAWNMAIDEAILLAHRAGLVPPTLRLYTWASPTVSLGLLQPYDAVSEATCQRLGIDLVRRPSGGGAVLHHQEVTYAVIVDGRMCPGGTSVMATYYWLAKGLIAGLSLLGIDASMPTTSPSTATTAAFCFVRLTGADLEVGGRKLGGSAQARRNHFVLQHGSLPLRLDQTVLAQLFGEFNPSLFTCLEEAAGRQIEPDEFAHALAEGFASALGITFEPTNLTDVEQELAALLVEGKYGTSQWTRMRKVDPNLRHRIADLLHQASS